MDWPSVAIGAGAALAVVAMGASPLVRFAMGHRAALVGEIEKERVRRVAAERNVADLLASVKLLSESLDKAASELAVSLRDLMMLKAENKRLRSDLAGRVG